MLCRDLFNLKLIPNSNYQVSGESWSWEMTNNQIPIKYNTLQFLLNTTISRLIAYLWGFLYEQAACPGLAPEIYFLTFLVTSQYLKIRWRLRASLCVVVHKKHLQSSIFMFSFQNPDIISFFQRCIIIEPVRPDKDYWNEWSNWW